MTSRDTILAAVRAARPPFTERPDVNELPRTASADLAASFISACTAAAAQVISGNA